MTKHFLEPAYLTFAKRLKEMEGLTHREIANRLNNLLNPEAGGRVNEGDVRKLLAGVNSAAEDARPYRQLQRIVEETCPSGDGLSSDFLVETSGTEISGDDSGNPPLPPSNREGGEA